MDPFPISIKTTRRVCGTGRRRWHDAETTGHGHPRSQGKDRGRQGQLRITIPSPAQPYGTQGATHGLHGAATAAAATAATAAAAAAAAAAATAAAAAMTAVTARHG